MADYGHDPTETAIPWKVFTDAGFDVHFATENGKQPKCDSRMLEGVTGAVLGAGAAARQAYQALCESPAFRNPRSWLDESFHTDEYDLVFLPGGHDKGVRQIIDSQRVHELLAAYFPLTKKPAKKTLAAVCHGVQVLAMASYSNGKSVLADVTTTALQHSQEQLAYQSTRLFLGDYYKTYGSNSPSVEQIVKQKLDDPSQFKSSLSISPFIVEDPNYNYLSARYPPDAESLAKATVESVKKALKSAG